MAQQEHTNQTALRPDRPLHPVRLRMFQPENDATIEGLAQHYLGPSLRDVIMYANPTSRERQRRRQERAYRNLHREEVITDDDVAVALNRQDEERRIRINTHILGVIQSDLGKDTLKEAADALERGRRVANRAVMKHADTVYPGIADAFIRDEVRLTQSPVELLEMYFNPEANDPVLRFEIKRQFLMTIIALQQEGYYNILADKKLAQIQKLLSDKIYGGLRGSTVNMDIYGVFDNQTNELLFDKFGKARIPRIFYDTPELPAPDGYHYKVLNTSVRESIDGVHVLALTDTKTEEDALKKAVRKVFERDDTQNDDVVDSKKDVQDTHRMKLVVMGTQEETDDLATKMFDILTDRKNDEYFFNRDYTGARIYGDGGRPTGVYTGKGDVRSGAQPGIGKSKDVNYTKIKIDFGGVGNDITVEILIQPIHSFLTEQVTVGTYDPMTGEFNGPAHPLVAVQREIPLVGVFYPHTVYNTLEDPSNHVALPFTRIAEIVDGLLVEQTIRVR